MNRRGVSLPSFARAVAASARVASSSPEAPPAASSASLAMPHEARTVTMGYPLEEQTIFTSSRPWRGCDVHIGAADVSIEILTFRVYALTGNVRSLLASGRWGRIPNGPTGPLSPQIGKWVCAARGGASQLVVTVQANGAGVPSSQISVSVFCSDQLTAPPDDVGALAWATQGKNDTFFAGTDLVMPEVLSLDAYQYAAAGGPTYMMLFDRPVVEGVIPNGSEPRLSWLISETGAIGTGRAIPVRHRSEFGRLCVCPSSTPLLLTQTNTVTYNYKVR